MIYKPASTTAESSAGKNCKESQSPHPYEQPQAEETPPHDGPQDLHAGRPGVATVEDDDGEDRHVAEDEIDEEGEGEEEEEDEEEEEEEEEDEEEDEEEEEVCTQDSSPCTSVK